MSAIFAPPLQQNKQFTVDLSQNPASSPFDIATASGGPVMIDGVTIYVSSAPATITSARIHTNQTNATDLMSAVEGAIANLTAQKNVVIALARPIYLAAGQKIQLTLAGAQGTGTLLLDLKFHSPTPGATLI